MVEETPERKRVRVNKACEACKRRKVKCDGNAPCSRCEKHNVECNYDYTSSKPRGKYRRSKESSTENSPMPQKIHVEDQTAKLLLQLGSREKSETPVGAQEENPLADSEPTERLNVMFTDPSATSNTPPWFRYSKEKYRFHTRYQNLLPYFFGSSIISELPQSTIAEHDLEIPRIQNYGWNMSGGHYLKMNASITGSNPSDLPVEIIDFDNQIHLSIVQKALIYYFQNVNRPLSIIHESVFWQQFNGFLEQRKTNTKSTRLFISMLYMILAITFRFNDGEPASNDTVGNTQIVFSQEEQHFLDIQGKRLEDRLFSYSYSIVTKLTFEWESFELIQSWLLIAFYLRASHRQIATWNALSKAVTMCQGMELDINQLPTKHMHGDKIKTWHCFWLCFVMDKLVSFQIGRHYLLEWPTSSMIDPETVYTFGQAGVANKSNKYDWFSEETIEMYKLSLLIVDYKKAHGREMTVDEAKEFRSKLQNWLADGQREKYHSLVTFNFAPWKIQPLLTYLDIAITFEAKSCLALVNPPNDSKGSLEFSIDYDSLLNSSELILVFLERLNDLKVFFVPWWLNMSLLFSVSIINLVLTHSGIRFPAPKRNLQRCMTLWHSLESARTKNPPTMLRQCVWCIQMLNYTACLRLLNTVSTLKDTVGVNFEADNTPNQNNFHQFSKAGEENGEEESAPPPQTALPPLHQITSHDVSQSATPNFAQMLSTPGTTPLAYPTAPGSQIQLPMPQSRHFQGGGTGTSTPSELLEEDLFGNLQWFDQPFI